MDDIDLLDNGILDGVLSCFRVIANKPERKRRAGDAVAIHLFFDVFLVIFAAAHHKKNIAG